MRKTTKAPSKSQSRSDAMKRAWATRRASAAAQAGAEVAPMAATTPAVVVPAVEAETELPAEIGVVSENDAAVQAYPSVELDLVTQPEVVREPDAAVQPALASPPVPVAELDSTAQPVYTAVQPDFVAAWTEHPVCLCGCSENLVRSKTKARQSLFKVGHDARLKSLAARIVKGTASQDEIPAIAREL